ncbi:MAG: anti-sigma factor family protein [Acidimicrobiia bacterium]
MSMDEDLLSGYLDGELTPTERAAVEEELARSPEWQAVLEELHGTRSLLRTLPWPDAPADLIAGVHEREQDEDVAAAPAPVREIRPRWRRPATWVATAVVAAAAVGVIVMPRPDRSEPNVPALADAHAARSSLDMDPIGALATMGVSEAPR